MVNGRGKKILCASQIDVDSFGDKFLRGLNRTKINKNPHAWSRGLTCWLPIDWAESAKGIQRIFLPNHGTAFKKLFGTDKL